MATITLISSDIVFLFQLAWNLGQYSRLTKWPKVYLERTMLVYLNRRVREVTSFTKALRSVNSHLEGTQGTHASTQALRVCGKSNYRESHSEEQVL